MDLRVQVRLLLAHMTTASLHPPPQLAWVWCPEVSPNLPRTSPVAQMVKCLPTIRETRARSLGRKDPLEQEMATHSSTLAWQIPWMEEPGRLQSTGSQRVRHDWATSPSLHCVPWGSRFHQKSFVHISSEGTVALVTTAPSSPDLASSRGALTSGLYFCLSGSRHYYPGGIWAQRRGDVDGANEHRQTVRSPHIERVDPGPSWALLSQNLPWEVHCKAESVCCYAPHPLSPQTCIS